MDLHATDTLCMMANCKLSQNNQDERKCTSNEKLLHIFKYCGWKEAYWDKEERYAWYQSLQHNPEHILSHGLQLHSFKAHKLQCAAERWAPRLQIIPWRYMQVWRCMSRHSQTSDRMCHLILHCSQNQGLTSVVSDFCRSVINVFTLLGCYAALNGQAVLGCLTLDDGTNRLFCNISIKLPINTV